LQRVPPLFGRDAPSLGERLRLRRGDERASLLDGVPITGVALPDGRLRLRLRLDPRQIVVELPDFPDAAPITSERLRPGALLHLHWQLGEAAASMTVAP
jgi:hypothetical protein